MTEFDFDELDKAVNNLMSNVHTNKRNPALDDPEDKVVSLGEPSSESAPVTPEPSPETSLAAVPAASPSLAVKRRGQFMDMIHPSSDMKSAPQKISRVGTVIAPIAPALAPEPSQSPVEDAPALEAAIPATSPVTPEVQITPEATPQETLSAEASPPLVADEPTPEPLPAPLSSPFLPDAKPEKRPLGNPSPVADTDTPQLAEDNGEVVPEQPPVLSSPAAYPEQPMPEELSSNLVALESNHVTEEVVAASNTESSPEPDVPESIQSTELPSETTPASATTPPVVPAGGSIAPQYTEAPSTGDQTNGSIYDTANYHKAIVPVETKKKPSIIKWVIAGILFLLVGAAAGVGYFFIMHS